MRNFAYEVSESFFIMKGVKCEESNEEWMEAHMCRNSGGSNDSDDASSGCTGRGGEERILQKWF